MSWETHVTEEPCFCGRGKRVCTISSDDWGRSESSEEMKCDDCAAKYVFAQVRGRDDRPFRWITREQFAELEAKRAAAAQAREEATTRVREELGDAFIAAFAEHRSRKKVWDLLREARIGSSVMWSFAEFNRQARDRGLGATLRLFINDGNADAIRAWLAERASP